MAGMDGSLGNGRVEPGLKEWTVWGYGEGGGVDLQHKASADDNAVLRPGNQHLQQNACSSVAVGEARSATQPPMPPFGRGVASPLRDMRG